MKLDGCSQNYMNWILTALIQSFLINVAYLPKDITFAIYYSFLNRLWNSNMLLFLVLYLIPKLVLSYF